MPLKYRYRVLGFLFILSIVTYIDRICISVAGKTIQEDLGLSPAQWGWVLGSFALAYSLFEIPTGALGDRIGPRRVLTRIVVWWSAFTTLTAAAMNLWQLISIRFLFGVGEAGAFPNIACTIARWFPKAERAQAQAVVWMATRIGSALSPLLVIPILHAYGWRVTFIVFGGCGITWALVWYWWIKDEPALQPGITAREAGELAADRPPEGVRHLRWGEVLKRPTVRYLMVMYFTHVWGAFFFVTWLFTFLENGRGYTKTELLQFSWLPFVCGAGANLLGGLTSDYLVRRIGLKWGRRSVGLLGHSVSALFIALAVMTQDKVVTIVCLAVAYAGSDFMLPVAWAVCLDIGGKDTGAVSGAMNTAGNFGGFVSTVIFGWLVNTYGGYDLPLVVTAIMSAISALVWLKIDATQTISFPHPSRTVPMGEEMKAR
jgi:MFS transporter, ACS family, glucarate transporter